MAHDSKIFDSQPITVQNLNGFDLSHINCGTSKCGQLVPVLRKLLMQGTKLSIGAAVNCELPPLATPFFGKIDFCVELFFVPCAILYGGWRQFITNQVATMFPSSQDTVLENGGYALPVLDFGVVQSGGSYDYTAAAQKANTLQAKNDGLADYLGVRLNFVEQSGAGSFYINLLPFLAYHKIVDTFYRNATTTKTWFAVNPNFNYGNAASGGGQDFPEPLDFDEDADPNISQAGFAKNVSLVWHSFYTIRNVLAENEFESRWPQATSRVFGLKDFDITFPDGVSVLQTRQRTYHRDYFTAGSITPQQGNPGTLQFNINEGDAGLLDGEITVHGLRAIVALQRFEEKLNYDPTYRGVMRNLFGSSPTDALLDEPSYIGRLVLPVYQKSVYQQQQTSGAGSSTGNPFVDAGDLAGRGAHGSFAGEGSFCKNYKVGCFGYLMALASLVPHAMYGSGIDREMLASEIGDFPFPDLQTIGMDQTYLSEVYADIPISRLKETFNFLPRYSWMKYIDDSVHGELRPGKSLESFALQRVFTEAPEFGTDFVTIAQTDLDGVFGTSVSVSNFSCWYEIYWVIKAVMPLAAFCIPTLGELHDVHTIQTTQGGSRL